MAKTVKHRKRFPGRVVQFPKIMFLNKNDTSICWESQEWSVTPLQGKRMALMPPKSLSRSVTAFKISAFTFSRESRNMRALVLRWKIHRFPIPTSNPRRNVKIPSSRSLLLSFFARQRHIIKNFPALKAIPTTPHLHLLIPSLYFFWYAGKSCSTY